MRTRDIDQWRCSGCVRILVPQPNIPWIVDSNLSKTPHSTYILLMKAVLSIVSITHFLCNSHSGLKPLSDPTFIVAYAWLIYSQRCLSCRPHILLFVQLC